MMSLLKTCLAARTPILIWGPPGCLAADTFISYESRDPSGKRRSGKGASIERLYQVFHGITGPGKGRYQLSPADSEFWVSSVDDDGRIFRNRVLNVVNSGVKECFLLRTTSGDEIVATADHKFLSEGIYTKLGELTTGDKVEIHNNTQINTREPAKTLKNRKQIYLKHHPVARTKIVDKKYLYHEMAYSRAVVEAHMNGLSVEDYKYKLNNKECEGLKFLLKSEDVHHIDENPLNDDISNLQVLDHAAHARTHRLQDLDLFFVTDEEEIESITSVGERDTYDIQMEGPYNNFVAAGFVVHNSGKTATVKSVVAQFGRPCWTLIASYREPADFGGLPVIKRDPIEVNGQKMTVVELAPPKYAVEAATSETGGVIFMDELSCTPPAVQAPALRMVHELVCGELQLPPEKIAIIAAANPPEQAAGGWELAPPLANRFVHVNFRLNPTEWVEEFPSYWAKPPKLELWGKVLNEDEWSKRRSMVAAFLRAKSSLLMNFPKAQSEQGRAWPSPRSWENVSRLMTAGDEGGLSKEDINELITGTVGPGAAQEFLTWLAAIDLPDPESLLANPDKFTLPPRGDQQYAILASVAAAVVNKNSVERWKKGWYVMVHAANNYAKDIAAAAARMLAKNRPPKAGSPPPEADKCFRSLLEAAGRLPK